MKKQNNEICEGKAARQVDLDKFNSVTQSVKPKNQNQEHNVKKEGIGRLNQMR